jgi:hypothetical protein
MTWTRYTDPAVEAKALKLAKGSYQVSLLYGSEAWSGSTLTGRAAQYSATYHRSRNELLMRLTAAEIPHHFVTEDRKKILIIGAKS